MQVLLHPSREEPYIEDFDNSSKELEGFVLKKDIGFTPPEEIVERRLALLSSVKGYEYVTWADPDDILIPEEYNKIASYLRDNPLADFVFIREQEVDLRGVAAQPIEVKYCCKAVISTRLLNRVVAHFKGRFVSDGHLVKSCESMAKHPLRWPTTAYLHRQHPLNMSTSRGV